MILQVNRSKRINLRNVKIFELGTSCIPSKAGAKCSIGLEADRGFISIGSKYVEHTNQSTLKDGTYAVHPDEKLLQDIYSHICKTWDNGKVKVYDLQAELKVLRGKGDNYE